MTDQAKIVPFGKYKGQPIEVLAADRSYLEWLSGQDWFRERYASIYQTVVVNNFTEASETPEHNALQVLFLDDKFCYEFVEAAKPGWCDNPRLDKINSTKKDMELKLNKVEDEIKRYTGHMTNVVADNDCSMANWYQKEITRLQKSISIFQSALAKLPGALSFNTKFHRTFEAHGIDVVLICELESQQKLPSIAHDTLVNSELRFFTIDFREEFRIEIKPSVGDDYPAVLRQMRANDSVYLFVDKFTATNVTREQFIQTFRTSGRVVVFRENVKH